MPHFDLEVAGTTVRLEGPDGLVRNIQRYFQAFAAGAVHVPAVCISWQQDATACRIARLHGDERRVRVDDPQFSFAATLALLAGEVAAARPDLVVLHANALRRPDGSALLLAGESGAGKTTLTMELARTGTGRALAEDWVPVDPAAAQALPFPRALNVRDGAGGERTEEHPEPAATAASLDGGAVVLLNAAGRPDASAEARPPVGETWWLTCTSPALVAWLSAAGARFEADGALVRAEFPGAMDGMARAGFLSTCREEGALVVHTARGIARRRSSPPPARPARPAWRVLEAAEALPALVPHVVRPAEVAASGAALLMQMARALAGARFIALVPGGTPRETAEALAEALRG